jgi:nitroreductase
VQTRLAIASKRDERVFGDEALPEETVRLILDAGRLAGSARNRQPWRFVRVESPEARRSVASAVYRPSLVHDAALVIGLSVFTEGSAMSGFDAGRAAQNMMLAAWDAGVVSCPSGVADPPRMAAALALARGESVATVLSFGRPPRPRDPERRAPETWSARARRRPLAELVRRV